MKCQTTATQRPHIQITYRHNKASISARIHTVVGLVLRPALCPALQRMQSVATRLRIAATLPSLFRPIVRQLTAACGVLWRKPDKQAKNSTATGITLLPRGRRQHLNSHCLSARQSNVPSTPATRRENQAGQSLVSKLSFVPLTAPCVQT